MAITEIFPNSTVKKVVFQIIFPNLFFIEHKIGDYQLKIMEKFPESSLILRRQIVFANLGQNVDIKQEIPENQNEDTNKIWQFRSKNNEIQLNILSNSLDISSESHKTYALDGAEKFRDLIEFATSKFLEITGVPIINRIGLRYIDECPLPSKDNPTLNSYYNTTFPINRFNISDAKEMKFTTVVSKGDYKLRYSEILEESNGGCKLILDFDSFAESIPSSDYLKVTDELHIIINEAYEDTIKEPVYEYMRRGKQ